MEKTEDLGIKGYKIIQNKDGFCFGSDAVLLSKFARVRRGSRVLDLCTGTGIIPVLSYALYSPSRIDAVEIIPHVADMARRTMELNGLSEIIRVENADLKNAPELYGKSVFDAVTCNPPYMNSGGGIVNPNDDLAVSRHEIKCTLDDVVRVSAQCLKPNGKLFMVHRADRLCDVISSFRRYKIEPKRLAMVYPNSEKGAILVLLEGLLGGRPQLKVEKPVLMYNSEGRYIQNITEGLV
ncbi:MAG: tRNA1(Val) (adenine(37)-N6)-methyltransferase [Clostridia bacterium]